MKIHIGTSGWSYEHWDKVFYPKELKSEDHLEYYSKQFNSVEINNSFYNLPSHKTILKWKHKTPDHFYFCPKLSQYITHRKKLNDVEKSFKGFLDRFKPLKERLGPILIQFPPQVTFNNPNVEKFLNFINTFYSWDFAIEARHKSWMTDETKKVLSEKKIAWVIADSGDHYPSMEAVTSDIVYLRFHGPHRQYASKYHTNILKSYARKIKTWLSEGKKIWAFFNNDFKGFAVQNANTLKELLDQKE